MMIRLSVALPALLVGVLFAGRQDDAPVPPTPFDQEFVLELSARDPALLKGRGPTQVVEYQTEFEGTLHIWTKSELDLFLQVEDALTGRSISANDDSGGGKTPYLKFPVSPGDRFTILVADVAESESTGGLFVLHLVAAPETATTRDRASAAKEVLSRSEQLAREGQLERALEDLKAAIETLVGVPGGDTSEAIADASWHLGVAAFEYDSMQSCFIACRQSIRLMERLRPQDHPHLVMLRRILADLMYSKGDPAGARPYQEAILAGYERTLPEDHSDTLFARGELARSMAQTGDFAGARVLQEAAVVAYERTLPEDHPRLLLARGNLANIIEALGDLAVARAIREDVLAGYERTLPEDHPDLLRARANLGTSMSNMGDLAGARAMNEAVLMVYERTLPADHRSLLHARAGLAILLLKMGDLARALEQWEVVVAGYERTLPEDHHDLLAARGGLAATIEELGDLAGARALREAVLAGLERTMPEDHPSLLVARAHLADSMHEIGDFAGARALRESVLAGFERTMPENHPSLLSARSDLADGMMVMGDRAGARALQESVLAGLESTLPEDHPTLLNARLNLAMSMMVMGDFAGSRALAEAVVAGYERTLPEDHPSLLHARGCLANTMSEMGDFAGMRALRESVLSGCERTLPEDHPKILDARVALAGSILQMSDYERARELFETVLKSCERTFPEDHPSTLVARANLCASMQGMGDLAGAGVLLESLLASYQRTVPEHDDGLLKIRTSQILSQHYTGDFDGARASITSLISGMLTRVLASLALSPREASQTVASEGYRLGLVSSLSASSGSELQALVFELIETMRLVSGEAARSLAQFHSDSELAPTLLKAASVRRSLNDLIAGAGREDRDAESIAQELTQLSLQRDRLEREASRQLAVRGVATQPIEVQTLATSLDARDVAIGYRRLANWHQDETTGVVEVVEDHLLAHVLRADGTLLRIDLGPAAELEQLATKWREALGAPLLRSVAVATEENAEAHAGAMLRERLLDPILAAAGDEVERLFVCADSLVFLIPLDALPLDKEGLERVGDRVRILNEVSFARILATESPVATQPSMLVFGGVDYDAEGSAPIGLTHSSAPIDESEDKKADDQEPVGDATSTRGTRSAMPMRFRRLLQSRYEAEATADLFEEAFDVEPVLLTRKKTTKAALFNAATGKRYVHLATHGWFAPESVRSSEDAVAEPSSFARMGIEERISGFAPMALCGLALAGANNGRDSFGRVTGILTAEELCSLDLSQCDLAILSACETNVGIRRAGQGIQSLQAALYAAGARTSITSLWKVDDAATRRLMELFYSNLWLEELPKAEALWQAKQAMRAEGHPPSDWAAWILTGDPN